MILVTGKLTSKTAATVILNDGTRPGKTGPLFATPYLPWPHQLRALDKLLVKTPAPAATSPEGPAATSSSKKPAKAWTTGLVPGTRELVWELLVGMGFFLWIPALIGTWVLRRRLCGNAGAWVLTLVNLAIVLFIWRVAVVAGYASERHLLLIVLGGCLMAAAGLAAVARVLAGLVRGRVSPRVIFAILLVGILLPFVARICNRCTPTAPATASRGPGWPSIAGPTMWWWTRTAGRPFTRGGPFAWTMASRPRLPAAPSSSCSTVPTSPNRIC